MSELQNKGQGDIVGANAPDALSRGGKISFGAYPALSVLVIDDQEFVRRIVTTMLEQIGFGTIETCNDGAEALEKVEGTKPDLIICDLNMKPMDGLSFLSHLRRDLDGKVRTVPVIILTGEISAELVGRASTLGCDFFLLKPVVPKKFKEKIDEVFKRDKAEIEDARAWASPARSANPNLS